MPVPFHSPLRAYLQDQDAIDAAIASVLTSGRYILGETVERFESEFSTYIGVPHVIGVASGTDALMIALRAAGVGPGDEVVTVANAGGYTTTACSLIGADPVYVDVEAKSLTMCPASLERMIGPRVRAVVVTHLYGSLASIESLSSIARRRGVMLIEDCAQAHGAESNGQQAGSFGDLATFSFYPTKNLGGLGDGGAVVCRENALAERVRQLRQYGWRHKYKVEQLHATNSRLDALQAAVLSVRLSQLDGRNQRRRNLVERYERQLSPCGVRFTHARGSRYVGHLMVVRLPRRDAIRMRLEVGGIGTDVHYPILDIDQPAWSVLGWRSDELPVSRAAATEIISLPLFPELTDEEVDEVCGAVESAVRSASPVGGSV